MRKRHTRTFYGNELIERLLFYCKVLQINPGLYLTEGVGQVHYKDAVFIYRWQNIKQVRITTRSGDIEPAKEFVACQDARSIFNDSIRVVVFRTELGTTRLLLARAVEQDDCQ